MSETNFTNKVAGNWVPSGNLKATITAICWWIDYQLDDSDWTAIEYGERESDVEAGLWYRYPLIGTPPLEIALARDVNADPVIVEVNSAGRLHPGLQTQIETTLTIFNSFDLQLPKAS